jgi:hypothetical protein
MLKIGGFKTARALLNKQLACDKIIISNPRVSVFIFPGQKINRELKKQSEEVYKQLLGNFKLIQANSVSITNAEVIAMDFISKETKFKIYNTTINLTDLLIDSTHHSDTSRTLFCKEIYVRSDKVVLGDNNASSEVTNLNFNTRDKILNIGSLAHLGIKTGSSLNSSANNISITGIEAAGAIDSMNIIVGNVLLKNTSLEIKGKEKEGEDKLGKRLLSGWVKTIRVKQVQVGRLAIKVLGTSSNKKDFILNNSSLILKEINLNSASKLDLSLVKNVEEIHATNNLVSFKSADNLYIYNFGGVEVNSRTKTISLKNFSVNPLLDEAAFAKNAKVQKDRYNISIKNLVCTSVNFDSLVRGSIYIGLVKTSDNYFKVYRDISYPLDSVSKVGKHPHQVMSKMAFPITINKFVATNTLLAYKEKNALSDTSGTLQFEKSTITLNNLTNKSGQSNKTDAFIETNILGSIPVQVHISFDLANINNGLFSVDGAITKPFNGQTLNQAILPMGLITIDKGNIKGVDFKFTGDNYNARGQFVMRYDNLKVSLYEKQKTKLDKKSITSLVANVIVKNSNPTNNKLRQADMVYRRNDYKSFFNMIWKFMFMSIKDILGAKF